MNTTFRDPMVPTKGRTPQPSYTYIGRTSAGGHISTSAHWPTRVEAATAAREHALALGTEIATLDILPDRRNPA